MSEQKIHDSQSCDCDLCRWADEVERRDLARREQAEQEQARLAEAKDEE